eukprot:m.301861 g.301861  ORF g.301861 m.301861 type:complete len:69 (+) comp16429_c0_seq4:1275-1481(+)
MPKTWPLPIAKLRDSLRLGNISKDGRVIRNILMRNSATQNDNLFLNVYKEVSNFQAVFKPFVGVWSVM